MEDFYVHRNTAEFEGSTQYGGVFYPTASSWCPADKFAEVCVAAPGPTIVANLTHGHSVPMMVNLAAGVALKRRSNGQIQELQVSNHPFPKTKTQRDSEETIGGIFAAIIIMVSYGFIPSGVTSY